MRTPADDVSRGRIQSWNVAVERRLPYDFSVDMAYVGTHGPVASPIWTSMHRPHRAAASTASRCSQQFGRSIPLNLWGPRTRTNYHSLQVAINRPFKNGVLLKGAYTLSRAKNETDDDGWAGLNWNAPSQLSTGITRWQATIVRTCSRWRSCTSCRTRQPTAAASDVAKVVLGDWQVNGIYSAYLGHAVHDHSQRRRCEMPGNTQTANLNGAYTVLDKHGDAGTYFDTSVFSQPRGVTFGNTGRNQFRGPGAWNLDFSLFRAFPIVGGQSGSSSGRSSSTC